MVVFAATASRRGAVADMTKPSLDMAETLARLSASTIFELRGEWRRLHRMPPPMRLSRDLLIRGITYRLQGRAYGGLSLATARKLEQAATDPRGSGTAKPAPPLSLRPGTRLVREWRGVTYTVLTHADGIEWHGERYRSLSVVARKITGARWSGPRFFGLRRPLDQRKSGRWRGLIPREPGLPSACPCDYRGPLVGLAFFRFEKRRRPLCQGRGGRRCASLIADMIPDRACP
jgi:hypothetical protein